MKKPLYTLTRVAGASLTNVAFLAVQSVLFIGLTPLVLRFLGEDAFGVWIILQSVIGFSNVANFKLGVSTSKFVAQFISQPDHENSINAVISINYLISFMMGAVVVAALLGLQGWLASNIDSHSISTETLSVVLTFVSWSILPLFLSDISVGILFGLLRYGIGNAVLLGQQSLLWIGILIIGWLKIDFVYSGFLIFGVMFLRFLFSVLFVYLVLRPKLLNPFKLERSLFSEIFRFTRMNWLGAVGMLVFNSLDKVVVGIILGPVTAGVYGIATGVSLRLSQLVDQATQALIPYTSNLGSTNNGTKITGIFQTTQKMSANLIAIVSTSMIIWMPQILSLWISPAYSEENTFLFRVILLGYSLFALYTPAYKISTGLGWVRMPNLVILITAVVMIVVLFFTSQAFGLIGAALSNYVFAGLLLINIYLARKLEENAVSFVVLAIWLPVSFLIVFSGVSLFIDRPIPNLILHTVFLVLLILTQISYLRPILPKLKKTLRFYIGLIRTTI